MRVVEKPHRTIDLMDLQYFLFLIYRHIVLKLSKKQLTSVTLYIYSFHNSRFCPGNCLYVFVIKYTKFINITFISVIFSRMLMRCNINSDFTIMLLWCFKMNTPDLLYLVLHTGFTNHLIKVVWEKYYDGHFII